MIAWLKKLFSKPVKVEPIINDTLDGIPQDVAWQTLLLQEDELLVYIDDTKQLHYFCSKPYDPNKEYKVLFYEE